MQNEVKRGREVFNLAMLVDNAAQQWGERVALYHYETGKTATFREVAYLMNRVGNALRASGVEIENKVAILMDDCPEWVYALFGALKIGATIIPLNTQLTEKDYDFFLGDSRARVLFTGASYFDKIEGIISFIPYLKRVVVIDGSSFREKEGRAVNWETFIQDASGELEVFQSFKETFGKPLYNCWGAQELGASPLCWRYGEEVPLEKVGSVGKLVMPGAQVKLVDEHGNEVPDGVPGEILVKVASDFYGYWHEPQEAIRKFVEGWYKPGDSLMRDEDGYYWYLGRLDDMVKVDGRQIFPVEVEETVARHFSVAENAVIPIKNEHGLTKLHAFVVLKEGYRPSLELAAQIQSFVKVELAPCKRPHHVQFVTELPRTATGKIQRVLLKEQAIKLKKE